MGGRYRLSEGEEDEGGRQGQRSITLTSMTTSCSRSAWSYISLMNSIIPFIDNTNSVGVPC